MKRALIFDLDDTLVPEFDSYRAAFASACAQIVPDRELDPEQLWSCVREAARSMWRASPVLEYCQRVQIGSAAALFSGFPGEAPELEYLRSWGPTFRRETWSHALAALGVEVASLDDALTECHRPTLAAVCRAYADVVPALTELARSHALAVLTNGPTDVQREKLRVAGLADFFRVVLISGETGLAKPDARAFAAAAQALGARLDEVVMVGDHFERDVLGARAAGIESAVWVDRGAEAPAADLPVVLRISHLGELAPLVAAM